jgi:hypothetical protein
LNDGEVWQQVATHPWLMQVLPEVLGEGFLLSTMGSAVIGPGEPAQPIHVDDGVYAFPRPHPTLVCNSMWALTDFTEEIGATRVIPGSHLWDRFPDEQNLKRTPERGQGYSMAKVIAERSFAEAAARSGRWDAITVCPGDNVGPILSAQQKDMGPWQHYIEGMLLGAYNQNGAYRPWMTVDVRDDAECHIRLLESVSVRNGERYIAWSTDTRNVEDVCASIDRLLPEIGHATPAVTDPFPDRIKAREAEFRAIWAGAELRNDRMRAATGITFRPLDESIRDCVESLMAIAKVEPVRLAGFTGQR